METATEEDAYPTLASADVVMGLVSYKFTNTNYTHIPYKHMDTHRDAYIHTKAHIYAYTNTHTSIHH